MNLVLAILIGTVFGFVLHRSGAADPKRIKGMLNLSDLHLMRVILFAIGFSSLLLFIGIAAGLIDAGHLSVKTTQWGVIWGGLIFGTGFALAGHCPGTAVCAIGGGRRDALVFILGGLLGAAVFTVAYGFIKGAGLMEKMAGGKVSLVETGKSTALLPGGWTLPVAGGIAIILMVIAWKLPGKSTAISLDR